MGMQRQLSRIRRRWVAVAPILILASLAYLCWSLDAGWKTGLPSLGRGPLWTPDDGHTGGQNGSLPLAPENYHELSSLSTEDGRFFRIQFGNVSVLNPNILPHPQIEDVYIIVGQDLQRFEETTFREVYCYATFKNASSGEVGVSLEGWTVLSCDYPAPPPALPVAPTPGGELCDGKLELMKLNKGPHDARVFWGPTRPYALFGSNSRFTCFGQWVQDFGDLMGWPTEFVPHGSHEEGDDVPFHVATEIQRCDGYQPLEKNFFLFWDRNGDVYVHYDIAPKRVFARLYADGSVGEDLAPLAAAPGGSDGSGDDACLARLLPKPLGEHDSVHQATNSLAVTMCRRKSDPHCSVRDDNTFLFTVFHVKRVVGWRVRYEPYALVFRRDLPFRVHAASRLPLWLRGRAHREGVDGDMLYMVSMSWRDRTQRYHGFLDDVLFLSFGVDDKAAAGMDVRAEDVLAGLALCDEGTSTAPGLPPGRGKRAW
ncbi:hypothetical protein VTK73DRAFT_1747 [Phialemonium thermophilum]|uniref:Uncharacterized protein n=1 Tax=Phialemonium thermophilum TaxID=223376 RepID=A0ABR3X7W3_9PEZI